MNKKISIIIPAYNSEKTLGKCIESIVIQSYSNFELLIINDGSEDSTLDIANKLALKDQRIKVFNKKNSGVSDTRNYGLRYMNGDYVAFIDSDDYIEMDFFENLLTSKDNIDIYVSGYKKKRFKEVEDIDIQATEVISRRQMINLILKSASVYSFPWNKLYKSSVIKDNNLFFKTDIHYGEDLVFLLEFLTYANSYMTVKGSKYIYVQHEESVSNKVIMNEKQLKVRLSDLEAMKLSIELLPENYIEEKNFLIKRIVKEGSSYYRISKKINASEEISRYLDKNLSFFLPIYKKLNSCSIKDRIIVLLNLNIPNLINKIKK